MAATRLTLQAVPMEGPIVLARPGRPPVTLEPEDAPLSEALQDRVADWADAFHATFDPWEPDRSGFASAAAAEAHAAEGHALALAILAELGAGYEVLFAHPAHAGGRAEKIGA